MLFYEDTLVFCGVYFQYVKQNSQARWSNLPTSCFFKTTLEKHTDVLCQDPTPKQSPVKGLCYMKKSLVLCGNKWTFYVFLLIVFTADTKIP